MTSERNRGIPNEELFSEVDAKSAFEFFSREARALPAEVIQQFRGDSLLAYHNVKAGAANVLEHQTELKSATAINAEYIKDMPNLAMAVDYAARQVNREPEATELRKILPRVWELRGVMMSFARALALSGHLPARDVDAIFSGSGKIDNASDCVQLAALFDKHWTAIEGKHGVTREQLKEASELGTRALSLLRPATAPKNVAVSPELTASVDIRDRLWTLLVKRYEEHLWRAGAWLFKTEFDEHVPPLLSRKLKHKKEAPVPG